MKQTKGNIYISYYLITKQICIHMESLHEVYLHSLSFFANGIHVSDISWYLDCTWSSLILKGVFVVTVLCEELFASCDPLGFFHS